MPEVWSAGHSQSRAEYLYLPCVPRADGLCEAASPLRLQVVLTGVGVYEYQQSPDSGSSTQLISRG